MVYHYIYCKLRCTFVNNRQNYSYYLNIIQQFNSFPLELKSALGTKKTACSAVIFDCSPFTKDLQAPQKLLLSRFRKEAVIVGKISATPQRSAVERNVFGADTILDIMIGRSTVTAFKGAYKM